MKGWGKGVAVYQKGGDKWKSHDKPGTRVGTGRLPGLTAVERFQKGWPANKPRQDDNDRQVVTAEQLPCFQDFEVDPETPIMKMYFSGELFSKFEPCTAALTKVVQSSGEDEEAWEDFETGFESFLNMTALGNWDGTKYDIVFYGCSGYTGYLTLEYVKRISLKKNPESFTFAMAGRTMSKVAAMRKREFKGSEHEDCPIILASYDDPLSVIDMVKSAHVIVNIAGPYMLTQGEVLIDACCWCGVDYCDVSGEVPWTLRLLPLHDHARTGSAKIAASSAFAGGYPDIWTFLLAKQLREEYGEELRRMRVYVVGGGSSAGSSGGTLASRAAMNQASDEVRKKMADPFALGGYIPEHDRNGHKAIIIKNGTGAVSCKMRGEDGDAALSKISQCEFTGIWRAPTPYAFFDTRIVRRSNMQLADITGQPYGRALNFQLFSGMVEAAQELQDKAAALAAAPKQGGAKRTNLNNPDAVLKDDEVAENAISQEVSYGAPQAGASPAAQGEGNEKLDQLAERKEGQGEMISAMIPKQGAMTVEQEKEFLKSQGKYFAQGEGPPLEDLGDAFTGIFAWAQTTGGHEARLAFMGGDGYFETARVAIETAMAFRFDRQQLPIAGGVCNCAVFAQTWVATRLINSGITFAAGRWLDREDIRPPPGAMGN